MYQNPLGEEASLIELLRHAPDRVDLDTFEAIIDELEELAAMRKSLAFSGFDSVAEALEHCDEIANDLDAMSSQLATSGFSSVAELSNARYNAVEKLTMYRDALDDLREKDKDN